MKSIFAGSLPMVSVMLLLLSVSACVPEYPQQVTEAPESSWPFLNAVWGSSPTDVFAVGDTGIILHYDGKGWVSMPSGTSVFLRGVWGTSGSNVYAVGDDRTILHYDGRSWTNIENGKGNYRTYLSGVWGSSASDVFTFGGDAVSGGMKGRILHYDGVSWADLPCDVNSELYGIWGSSAKDIFASGLIGNVDVKETRRHDEGRIVRYNGRTWDTIDRGSYTPVVNGIWGSSKNDIYVLCYNSNTEVYVRHYDGNKWQDMSVKCGLLRSIWGTSARDVFAVGSVIAHYDGKDWTLMPNVDNSLFFQGVWGSSATDVFVVGRYGILHYDGETWSPMAL